MKNNLSVLVLALLALFFTASATLVADEVEMDSSAVAGEESEIGWHTNGIWYCEARSFYTGAWAYWYSYNVNYARARALSACQGYSGTPCAVACRWNY